MTTTVATTSTAAGPNIGKTTQKQFSIFYLILTKHAKSLLDIQIIL